MTGVEVGRPEAAGSTVRCDVSYDRPLRPFFSGDPFVADYDVDVEDVPESVLVVPVLAQVCPVAWANGADVHVGAVDDEYLSALREAGRGLARMYPEFVRGGRIYVEEAIDTEPPDRAGGRALLFSGGVDSVASYVRHREEDPALISIQGWVIGRDQPERWERVRRQIDAFADPRGAEVHFVSSNMLEFLHTPMLQAHFQRYVDGAWYSSVGQGLGLLGLCAPLAYGRGFDTIYMAASHTEAFPDPWGSHPLIDDRVRWTGTRASHDGFDLTRQEKIELIADYVREGNHDLALRTCIHSDVGGNCSRCEKCFRTAVGLVVSGLDPNEFGYDVDGSTFPEIRSAFEDGELSLNDGKVFLWDDVRNHVDPDRTYPWPEAHAFLEWLRTADLDEMLERSNRSVVGQIVHAGMRHTPHPVYATVYSVYDRVRTWSGGRRGPGPSG